MKNAILWAGVLSLLLLLPACKKDETEETKPTLTGLAINSAIPYVRVGHTLEFKADVSSISSSDGTLPETVGLAWQVNSGTRDTLTLNAKLNNPAFRVTAEEEGTYSINCYLFGGSDYYATSAVTSFQAINPATALEGLTGQTETVLGSHVWMSHNLYGTESGKDYENSEVVATLFGRFYTWEEAQAACPKGWRLPTAEEFDQDVPAEAGALMADAVFLGEKMWAYWPEVPITNQTGFNAIPVGFIDFAGSNSAAENFQQYAAWWTASEDGEMGLYRYIHVQEPQLMKGRGSKSSLAMSVRCVK